MFFAGRFTLSQSSPPVRNATYLRTFFLEFIYLFRKILSTSIFFCCSIYIEISQNSYEECNEFEDLLFWRLHYAFQETLCSVTLAHIRSLHFIQVYIFIPLMNSAPFLRFSHILLYTIFCLMYITTRNIFLIPDDAVAQNLIIIFNFSNQRPHLNYIFLPYVYSFDTMEFCMKHKC